MVRLGDLFEFKNGRSFKKTEWKQTGLPIIRIQNLNNEDAPFNYFDDEYDSSIEVNSGDLLFSWSGTVGSSFGPHIWHREKGVLNQHIFKLNFIKEMEKRYAFYSLLFITAEIERSVVGAVGLVHVTKKSLNEFQIPHPPIPEQQRIVAILDQAFADIEKARANAEKNLKNARELFDSYLNQVFSQRGEGWVENKLDDVCELVGGGTPSKSNEEFYNGMIPWATIRDMKDELLISTEHSITEEAVANSSTNVIKAENIVIATRVGLGKVCLLQQDTAINQDLKAVIPKDGQLTKPYLFHWLKSVAHIIVAAGTGATVQGVKLPFIKSLPIPIPPISEQQQIVAKLNELSVSKQKLIGSYETKLVSLDELKKSLLQKAFSGELTKTEGMVA